MCSSIHLESSFSTLHNKSWWQLTGQWTLASQGTLIFSMTIRRSIFPHQRRDIRLGYSYAGHWTSRKHLRNHSRLYLSMVLMLFCQKNTPDGFRAPVRPRDVIAAKTMPPSGRAHPQVYCDQKWSKLYWQFQRYWHFCIIPLSLNFSYSDHYQTCTWDMASEPTPTPQQLITQSAQATADAIASALTARTVSISLPVYDWNSQDAYHSFSIFCRTLENWLLLNHLPPDSEDHLRYVFEALGTKSLEMHAQWMPTGSKEEQ